MKDRPDAADRAVIDAARDAIIAARERQGESAAAMRIAVALSGGRDSMVLLDALARLAPEAGVTLSALHVHHGLSPHAEAWVTFCADECAKRGVPFTVHRPKVERRGGASLEATARTARYNALANAPVDFVALAHHADDQAETLLLQLLRGAGPHGLAAMPTLRPMPGGVMLLRPFLALSRATIGAYATARGLGWVDDESNANTDVKRNFIRHEIAPRLGSAFPGYPATLARSAAHQAEATVLADELAQQDALDAIDGEAVGATLDRAALIALDARAPHRARNLLRWFLRRHGLRAPSTARLAAMQRQLVHAAPDARVRLIHDGAEVGIHRGRICVYPRAVAAFSIPWHGEASVALPHGTLEFESCTGAGIANAALTGGEVTIRARAGGERIQLDVARPRRALKRVLLENGMPLWLRESLPLVFCGKTLAVVPGIGVDIAFRAAAGAAGRNVNWRPNRRED